MYNYANVRAVTRALGGARGEVAVMNRYLNWLTIRNCRKTTIISRRRGLIRLRRAIGMPLLQATHDDLISWAASLDLTPAGMSAALGHARSFYRWAYEIERMLPDNPAARLPSVKAPPRMPRPVDEEIVEAAIAGAPDRIRAMLVLAGWAGLRAQEIAYLRREDVLDRADPPVILVSSQGAKGGRERIVDLAPVVLAELAPLLSVRRGYLFPRRSDQYPGPLPPHAVSHECNDYLRQFGVTLHQWRHRFGTQLYQVDNDLRMVQDQLGHSTLTMAARYAAWNRKRSAAAVAALPVPPSLRRPRNE